MNKKILFFLPYPPPFAGPETIAKELLGSDTFNKRNDILFLKSSIRSNNISKGKFDIIGVIAFIKVYLKFLISLQKSSSVYYYLASNKIGFFRDSIYILTANVFQVKVVVQYHGSNFLNFYNLQGKLYKKHIKYTLSKINCIILSGKGIESDFQYIYDRKICFLKNGLNSKVWIPTADRRLNKLEFTIFFMSHLFYSKGIHDLISAYKILFARYGKKIRFVFAGEKPKYQSTIAEFLKSPWKENFLLKGKEVTKDVERFINECHKFNSSYLGVISSKEKIQWFIDSDVFILPSYTEGLSMACLEAMAMGLPIITTPVGAMPEVIVNGKNGIITPIGDPEKLAESIELLINDNELCQKIQINNIEDSKRLYNIEKIATDLLTIIDNI
jgi:glycosyltransferase involved in cell wall biosynthesis